MMIAENFWPFIGFVLMATVYPGLMIELTRKKTGAVALSWPSLAVIAIGWGGVIALLLRGMLP